MNEIGHCALKYERAPHLEWRSELFHESPSDELCLAHPGTTCLHHGKGIQSELGRRGLSLFQRDPWFNAMFLFEADDQPLEIYCNIALSYTRDSSRFTWVDLEPDIVVTPDSAASLVDLDEVETNSANVAYPKQVAERAQATASMLLSLAEKGEPPLQ